MNYYKSFCIINLKSILTIRPIRIKNKPKYELKEKSKEITLNNLIIAYDAETSI